MPGRLKFRFEAEELWILIKINHNCKGLIENYFALRYIVWDVFRNEETRCTLTNF